MRILILEDEKPIAKYIDKLIRKILSDKIESTKIIYELSKAIEFISQNEIDLCLLDLNLTGEDGYELLKHQSKVSFSTIVISANTNRAIEAFEYDVLDFIGKPFDEERLRIAVEKFLDQYQQSQSPIERISLRKDNKNIVVPVNDIKYFKAAGIYVEVYLKNGQNELLDKTMDQLEQELPPDFFRAHRSVIVDVTQIKSYYHSGGGIYQIILNTGEQIPLSRQKYKELQNRLNH